MGISVLISTTLRNALVSPASISIRKALGEASTCQITTKDATGAFIPVVGNSVEVQDQSSTVQFFGSIQENEVSLIDNQRGIQCLISATDLNHSTTRRLAGEYSWTNKTVLEIVTDIVANSLQGDLTDISLVEAGPTIATFAISYPSVKEAFDKLAELSGMEWYVDELNKLRFFVPASPSAPFSITDTTNVSSLSIRETREDYCNWVVGRVGGGLLDPVSEDFVGDGVADVFILAHPVGQIPSVFVNGVAQTVGILGVDTGKDWYWSENSAEIEQDAGGVVLTAMDTLSVTYVGVAQFYVEAEDLAERSARATAENNSGIYQRFILIDGLKTRGDAQAVVDAYLERYNQMTFELVFETNERIEPAIMALRPGDVLPMSVAEFGETGNYLVRSIVISHIDGVTDQADCQWSARVEAVKGPVLRSFLDMFAQGAGTSIGGVGTGTFKPIRTLLLKNTAVGDDIADRVTIYAGGTGYRFTGVLRIAITEDLTVRVRKRRTTSPISTVTIITLTIPASTPVDTPLSETVFADDPQQFLDGDVLIFDVTESDGQVDAAGVASFTLEWIAG